MEAVRKIGWSVLPYPGGLLDQPEWLIDDLLAINEASERVEDQIRARDE
jgi:hypothetical protein